MLDRTKLPKVVNEFLDQLIIENKSINTIESYGLDLQMFLRFVKLHKQNKEIKVIDEKIKINTMNNNFIKTITHKDINAFLRYLKERGNEASSMVRRIRSIKKFFKYLIIEDVVKEDPSIKIVIPKTSKKKPVFLNLEDSKKLLKVAEENNNERDFCIITLFLNCGMRLDELINIEIPDIDFTNNKLRIRKGKGDKERIVDLNDACIKSINEYLIIRDEIKENIKNEEDKNILFISNHKRRMSDGRIEVMLKETLIRANLADKKITPHKLRHTFATLMLDVMNIVELQEVLGHESVATTQIYTHVDNKVIKAKMNKNPLND